ncbi:MAG: DUF4287 domain-containing protein [Phycisphaerae bacterium]
MIANLEEKTGKTLAQWIKIVTTSKLEKHGEIIKMLKTDHELTHGYANLVAHKARKSAAGDADPDDLIGNQYAGKKEHLKPIYDAIIKQVQKFGEVEIAPKKAYVSLRAAKQFAIIQPSTAKRIDVGINLKGIDPTDRLEASGSFNSMVSHRVRIENADQVDKELQGWLKDAFKAAQ